MPLRQVYGKKPTKAAFAVSDIFTESSPSQTISRPKSQHSNDNELYAEATKAIQKLEIKENEAEKEDATHACKVLTKHDVNSRSLNRRTTGRTKPEEKEHEQPPNIHPSALIVESAKEVYRKPRRAKTRTAEPSQKEQRKSPGDVDTSSSLARRRPSRPYAGQRARVIDSSPESEPVVKNVSSEVILPPEPRRSPRKRHVKAVPTETPETRITASGNSLPCKPYISALIALTSQQKAPIDFTTWSDALSSYFKVSKIAEASYSEVYRLSLKTSATSFGVSDESVLKLIALKPAPDVSRKKTKTQVKKEDGMSAVEDVASEVKLLERMAGVPGFTNFRALHVVQGRPSKEFCDAWKTWNKGRSKENKSTFADPSRKTSFDEKQYWAILEMQDAGTDVEQLLEDEGRKEEMKQIWAVWDIFWQTVLAVAKGENEAKFEHRDLHLGNICVRRKKRTSSDVPLSEKKIGFVDLEATIIDYTLSRADMQTQSRPQSWHSSSSASTIHSSSTLSQHSSHQVEVVYNPLHKQRCIFEGNAEDDYQYEIYRYMRQAVTRRQREDEIPEVEENLAWKSFHPVTNLIWLHFVLAKLCESLQWPLDNEEFRAEDLDKALGLELILRQLSKILDPMILLRKTPEDCLVKSAAELVGLAVIEGWLDQEDIEAY